MKKHNINNNQLSIKLNIDRTNITKYLKGKGNPSLETLEKLTQIFNCSYDDLLSDNEVK